MTAGAKARDEIEKKREEAEARFFAEVAHAVGVKPEAVTNGAGVLSQIRKLVHDKARLQDRLEEALAPPVAPVPPSVPGAEPPPATVDGPRIPPPCPPTRESVRKALGPIAPPAKVPKERTLAWFRAKVKGLQGPELNRAAGITAPQGVILKTEYGAKLQTLAGMRPEAREIAMTLIEEDLS